MMDIDRYAYLSRLKGTDPSQKLFFSALTLGVCLWSGSMAISVAILVLMGGLTVLKGGTPLRFFIRLLLVPMSFLLVGVLTIAVNFSGNQEMYLVGLPLAGAYLGITREGLREAAELFLKALGAVSCLYYLSLSTPMVDLLSALRRLKVPKLLVELMSLVYRFIFVLLETVHTILTSQNSRLGYSSLAAGYRSLGKLASSLFLRAYKRSDEIYTALEARGYEGELNVLEEPYERSWRGYAAALAVNIFLIAAALALRRVSGGWH